MRKEKGSLWGTYLLLTLGGLVMIFPFYFMIVTSFKSKDEAQAIHPSFWPHPFTIEPYIELVRDNVVFRAAVNSVIVAILSTVGTVLICALAGYAFAKHRFAGRDVFFVVLLSTMMIPGAVLLIPGFLLFRDFG